VSNQIINCDVTIIGGGIAGITSALELLESNLKVILVDRDLEENFGGLAKESFGGMFFVDTPHQRRLGIKDSTELALKDWLSFAEFEKEESWQKKWAEQYTNECRDQVYQWLEDRSISFFPLVHWVERGYLQPGNSVPRFHMVWGTGHGLATTLIKKLRSHRNYNNLILLFGHKVEDISMTNNQVSGVVGIEESTGKNFEINSSHVVVAAGGIGGNIEKVKANWYKPWGTPPDQILNGSHRYALGDIHEVVEGKNGKVCNLEKMWNYAAGVPHHKPNKPNHGLSLVPPKSALWLDYKGRRFGPMPLISGYDTRFLVEQVCKQEKKYSWQVMNLKIAYKEFAVSGSEHNTAIRDKNWIGFLKAALLGNRKLVDEFIAENESFVIGNSIEELGDKMNQLTGENDIGINYLRESINTYDLTIDRGPKFFNDEQLRRIAHLRQYRGDRLRTCKFQKINDKNAMPLIAIREYILSRKSLGGIQTDLNSRVLKKDNGTTTAVISGLYAVGEAAGFGGGGMHGKRSLEGTFLGGCVLTARMAARSIIENN
jgi:predicted oxidoreductase